MATTCHQRSGAKCWLQSLETWHVSLPVPGAGPRTLTQVDVSKGPTPDLPSQAVLVSHTQLHDSLSLQREAETRGSGKWSAGKGDWPPGPHHTPTRGRGKTQGTRETNVPHPPAPPLYKERFGLAFPGGTQVSGGLVASTKNWGGLRTHVRVARRKAELEIRPREERAKQASVSAGDTHLGTLQ